MRLAKLGTVRSDETKAKMSANRASSMAVRVLNHKSASVTEMPSIRRSAAHIGVSYATMVIHRKKHGIYKGKGYPDLYGWPYRLHSFSPC